MQRGFFRYGVAAFIVILAVVGRSAGRELRPSEHGLAYEESAPPATHNGTEEMLSFFGSREAPPVPLPEADNIGGDAWWRVHGGGGESSRDVRRDHVRTALLVASVVCGSVGVALLVVSGVVLLVRRRRQRAELGSSRAIVAVKA